MKNEGIDGPWKRRKLPFPILSSGGQIMKFRKILLVAGLMLAVGPLITTVRGAGEVGEAMEPETEEIRRMEVKRYLGLSGQVVAEAIVRGVTRDVRFEDTFEEATGRVSSAVRTVRLRGERYRIAAMFRTQNDIVCLIPADQQDTLDKVGPPNPMRIGQKITIEGTTLGMMRGMRTFLVDRVLTGHEEMSVIEHELILRWPRSRRRAEPQRIAEAGEYTTEFPCRYEEEKTERIRLVVQRREREAFMEELRRQREAALPEEEGAREEQPEQEKQYSTYEPAAVYKHIMRDNVLHINFNDRVRGEPPNIPRQLTLPNGRRLRIGTAFDTYIGITCLVPSSNEELTDLARRVIPGQEVQVWGTTLPSRASYKPMVVDRMELPGTTRPGESEHVWVVQVSLPGEDPKRFYEVGSYALDFPCQHMENRTERVVAELREVRVIRREVEEAEAGETAGAGGR
jgi:hypothetical protein